MAEQVIWSLQPNIGISRPPVSLKVKEKNNQGSCPRVSMSPLQPCVTAGKLNFNVPEHSKSLAHIP